MLRGASAPEQQPWKEKGVVSENKSSGRGREEKKNASKDQRPAEVGLLAGLLSELRAANKRGIVGIVSCLPSVLNDYVLTPSGENGKDTKVGN